MKHLQKTLLIIALTVFWGCGSSSLLTRVSGTVGGVDPKTAYTAIATAFSTNNFAISGDTIKYSGLLADYKTPWTYSIQGDGENFHKKIFTLGMEVVVNIAPNAAGGLDLTLTPFYWQSEDLSEFDKKTNSIADRVNASLNKDALKKTDPAASFPNSSPLRYYKEDDRESGTLTPEDTKVYKSMIVVFSKTLTDLSSGLGIGKERLKIEIKE